MPTRLRALFLLAFAMAGGDVPGRTDAPAARGGLMDLSRWDFDGQGSVALRGGPGASLRLTVTVGVAVLEDGLESFEDLLRRAERALYAGKAAGRNQVKVAQRDDT